MRGEAIKARLNIVKALAFCDRQIEDEHRHRLALEALRTGRRTKSVYDWSLYSAQ